MTKVILLGDCHIGCRNASLVVANNHLKFIEEQLFPYMLENGIDTIIQCGDLFDTRKYTSHVVLQEWHNRFFQMLRFHNFKLHMVLGNHDLALRNSLSVNSPSLFLSQYNNITIYDTPTTVSFNDIDFLMVPWVCSENYDHSISTMKKSKAKYCVGHFEFANFEMHQGQTNVEGLDHKQFKRFDTIFSGHYHTRSKKDNIQYIGTPYEMTWIDYDDPKGFHVLDLKTHDLEFIKNKFSLFNKLYYNDKDKGLDYFKGFDLSNIENTYVKVIVVSKTDPYQFDRLLDRLYQIPLVDLKIVEDMSELNSDSVSDDELIFEDTKTLIESYIDESDFELDKDKLKTMMKTLYTESLEVMV